jgi:hypothetical protein
MARSMFSLGMLAARALSIARRSRGLPAGSAPPWREAIESSRISWVKSLPRFASEAAFLRLIVAHLEWPDIAALARASRGTPAGALGTTTPGQGQLLGVDIRHER